MDTYRALETFRQSKYQIFQNLETYRQVDGNDFLLYQYRSNAGFWSIIQGDELWMTNARFSNDHAEQIIGTNAFVDLLGKAEYEELRNDPCKLSEFRKRLLPSDCYISCFCEDGDRLSQWRGYAEEGVSMGFDFSNIRPFAIEHREGEIKKYINVYNNCCKVEYIDKSLPERIKDELENKQKDSVIRIGREIVPYIKHQGFKEEAEFRLVFFNRDGRLDDCIRYRLIDGINSPYIVVRAGLQRENSTPSIVRVCCQDTPKFLLDEIRGELKKSCDSEIADTQVVDCFDGSVKSESVCVGCTIRQIDAGDKNDSPITCNLVEGGVKYLYKRKKDQYSIHVSEGNKQKEICAIVRSVMKALVKTNHAPLLPVWCDGHLPLRRVIVGPSRNREEIRESIEQYCAKHWWLQDVDVKESVIPYRKSLK